MSESLPTCVLCKRSLDAQAQTRADQPRAGVFLCYDCAPRFELPGYDVGQRLGETDEAVRFAGRQQPSGAPVALHVFKAPYRLDRQAFPRFVQSVRARLEPLDHPRVVRCLGVTEAFPHAAIAYEYLEVSVEERLEASGAFELPRVLRLARTIAEALVYLHGRGQVHGDLQARDVLLDPKARCYKLQVGAGGQLPPRDMSSNNAIYHIPKAAGHGAPELVNGGFPDARTDVYCLGALLFHTIQGERLFADTQSALATFERIRKEAPPPLRTDSRPMQDVVTRCLAKDPADRFQTAGELLAALEAV